MADKAKTFWAKVKDPLLFTALGALLILAMKNCNDGNKARDTNETVKAVAANVDTIKHNTDTVKAEVKKVHKIVKRTEKKVDALQETADSILTKVEECCDCNCNPKEKLTKIPRVKVVVTPDPDTIVIKKTDPVVIVVPQDTVRVEEPVKPVKKDTVLARVVCKTYWIYR